MPVDTSTGSRYWTLKAGEVVQGTIDQFPVAPRSYYQRLGVEALLALPVFVDGDLWGSLDLGMRRPLAGRWSEADVAILRTLADSLGSAITKRRIREQLAERVDELGQSNAELEQFAYVASHDLQEPLRMVSSYTQLLARRYQDQLDADAHEFIAYAVDGANRMQGLINDLLAYSRVGTRGKPFAPVAADRALDRALLNLKLTIEESGATIHRSPLPTVLADEGQLVQLFQNLISNAIKFRGDQPSAIQITAERDEAHWRLAVSDNGIGFEPEYAEQIFAVFERLHAGHVYAGTGIGLAICKKVVERHKGRIWAESALGQGATFLFTLPGAR
jgi:light-regulated signal transduction histidine kinase (bacteriophytochrome)